MQTPHDFSLRDDCQNLTPAAPGELAHLAVYRAAVAYVASGFSVLPILADGTKRPACPWRHLQSDRPWPFELEHWFGSPFAVRGIAIVTGTVSGNLEVIDCDSKAVAKAFWDKVKTSNPSLASRLVLIASPRGGHVYYRCPVIGTNCKLARAPDPSHDNQSPRTLFDLKSEGGYVIAPPTPGRCHPSGRPYVFASRRRFHQIATITVAEREELLAAARSLNTWTNPRIEVLPKIAKPKPVNTDALRLRPGDEYERRAEWTDILTPHGWTRVSVSNGVTYWRRPRKSEGHSATTDFGGGGRFHVFSSSAFPFVDGGTYTKFAAYAMLNFEGDFSQAASELRRLGFGSGVWLPSRRDTMYAGIRLPRHST